MRPAPWRDLPHSLGTLRHDVFPPQRRRLAIDPKLSRHNAVALAGRIPLRNSLRCWCRQYRRPAIRIAETEAGDWIPASLTSTSASWIARSTRGQTNPICYPSPRFIVLPLSSVAHVSADGGVTSIIDGAHGPRPVGPPPLGGVRQSEQTISSYDPGQVARQKDVVGVWMTPVRKMRAAQGRGWSWRRRLLRLLSADWVPPSVPTSRGFPRSRGRASGMARPHN